jgi:hypothetical protein
MEDLLPTPHTLLSSSRMVLHRPVTIRAMTLTADILPIPSSNSLMEEPRRNTATETPTSSSNMASQVRLAAQLKVIAA